ncbi:unnamed protein product, partial [Pelagomonas calceolata]
APSLSQSHRLYATTTPTRTCQWTAGRRRCSFCPRLLEVRRRPARRERALELLLGRAHDAVRQREFDVVLGVLDRRRALQVRFVLHDARSNNLNRPRPRAVAAGHLRVELVDGAREFRRAVLAVHVVRAASAVVAEHDVVRLDDAVVLLSDFVDIQHLARRLLHLAVLVHVVPEAGPCQNFVRREQLHAVDRRVRLGRRRRLAADDLVELEARHPYRAPRGFRCLKSLFIYRRSRCEITCGDRRG